MPYSIQVGDILEYSIDMRFNSQRCLNVYHYRYKVAQTPITDGRAALLQWLEDQSTDATGLFVTTKVCMSSKVKLVAHRIQVIYPTRKPAVSFNLNMNGMRDETALPTGVAACVSLTQGLAGRALNGRKEIPGLLMEDLVDDLWEPAAIVLLNNVGQAATFDRLLAGAATNMENLIFKRANPINSQRVDGFVTRPQARYLTRRTLGRGE